MSITVRLTGRGLRTRTICCDGCGTSTAESAEAFAATIGDFVAAHRTCLVADAHDRTSTQRVAGRRCNPADAGDPFEEASRHHGGGGHR